jgi:hypothetical protein
MKVSSSTYRNAVVPFLVVVAAALALGATACGDDVPLYDFPRAMCGETAIQGSPGNSKTDDPSVELVASDGARVFWFEDDYNFRGADRGVLLSGAMEGGDRRQLATDKLVPLQVEVDDEQVFWAGGSPDGTGMGTALKAVDKHGGAPRVVAVVEPVPQGRQRENICHGGSLCPFGFALDDTDVYFTANDTLRRVDKRRPNSMPTELARGPMGSVAVDASDVYWLECPHTDQTVRVMKLAKAGGMPVQVASVVGGSCDAKHGRLVLDGDTIHWVARGVWSIAKSGGTPVQISDDSAGPTSLAVTNDAVYWVSSGRNGYSGARHGLVRVAKTGGPSLDLVPPRDDHSGYNDDSCDPREMAIDGRNLYWVVRRGVLRRPL